MPADYLLAPKQTSNPNKIKFDTSPKSTPKAIRGVSPTLCHVEAKFKAPWHSIDQRHAVAVTEEAVAFADGFVVGAEGVVVAGESTDEHE